MPECVVCAWQSKRCCNGKILVYGGVMRMVLRRRAFSSNNVCMYHAGTDGVELFLSSLCALVLSHSSAWGHLALTSYFCNHFLLCRHSRLPSIFPFVFPPALPERGLNRRPLVIVHLTELILPILLPVWRSEFKAKIIL